MSGWNQVLAQVSDFGDGYQGIVVLVPGKKDRWQYTVVNSEGVICYGVRDDIVTASKVAREELAFWKRYAGALAKEPG